MEDQRLSAARPRLGKRTSLAAPESSGRWVFIPACEGGKGYTPEAPLGKVFGQRRASYSENVGVRNYLSSRLMTSIPMPGFQFCPVFSRMNSNSLHPRGRLKSPHSEKGLQINIRLFLSPPSPYQKDHKPMQIVAVFQIFMAVFLFFFSFFLLFLLFSSPPPPLSPPSPSPSSLMPELQEHGLDLQSNTQGLSQAIPMQVCGRHTARIL